MVPRVKAQRAEDKADRARPSARAGRDHHVEAEKVGWIVKFKRGLAQKVESIPAAARNFAAAGLSNRPFLILSPQTYEKTNQWVPYTKGPDNSWALNKDHFRIRYWNGKLWTVKYNKAHRYRTQEYAESVAFKLTLKEKSLIGELEVEKWVECSRPKSRRPQTGSAPV